MIVFQDTPDAIFLAIVDEALAHVREVHLFPYRAGYRPTRADRGEIEESYRHLFPDLRLLFARKELVRVIDRLRCANRDERRRYELTDYHWLVRYACLEVYCDLHNDGVAGDQVGRHEIEHIDFDAIVERFFFDTDFLMGATLLAAEEAAPGQLRVTRQAWKIAAGLRPEAKDLGLTVVTGSGATPAACRSAASRRSATSARIRFGIARTTATARTSGDGTSRRMDGRGRPTAMSRAPVGWVAAAR